MLPTDWLLPNKNAFDADPFGYSALAWHKWGMLQTLAGFPVDITRGPTQEDLKSPVLWLSHAQAMAEAARIVIQGTPNFEAIPADLRGVSHCQYHAVALMLVGYSLEICAKAMLIMKKGIAAYQSEEKKHHHHSLEKLTDFVPGLNEKDKAILSALSHFVRWAGRYPDPGFGKADHAEAIFSLSERYQISAKDLFALASRIMANARKVVDDLEQQEAG